jgi:hypothetical protein
MAVDNKVSEFVHQGQQFLFEAQPLSQNYAPLLHAAQDPGNERVADDGYAAGSGELL